MILNVKFPYNEIDMPNEFTFVLNSELPQETIFRVDIQPMDELT